MSDAVIVSAVPRPLTPLIGRRNELAHLQSLLEGPARLATITGIGGIGKTRLALQAALELEPQFAAGAGFVPLATVTRGADIPPAIAHALRMDESVETIECIAARLGTCPRLLVLDNLEQIPDAALTVLALLTSLPNLRILVTSQARLELDGEYVIPLEPMDTHADAVIVDDLRALDAVQLFIERARAIQPSLDTSDETIVDIAEICHMLEGIPLAIELAAARITVFTPNDLKATLGRQLPVLAGRRPDAPHRLRTMRNAISWTYELLDNDEQRMFCWLSVIEGDFSMCTVANIIETLHLPYEPVEWIDFLISRSLIRRRQPTAAGPRFAMLQIMREFGHEQLLLRGEDSAARLHHANHIATIAEDAEPHLMMDTDHTWHRRLDDDWRNIQAAMAWSLENDHHDLVLRIVAGIWRFADAAGYAKSLVAVSDRVTFTGLPAHIQARGQIAFGYLHEAFRDLERAEQAFAAAEPQAIEANDTMSLARSFHGRGLVAWDQSDLDRSREFLLRGKAISGENHDVRGQVSAMHALAAISAQVGDYDTAIQNMKAILPKLDHAGDLHSLAISYGNLGAFYISLERYDDAEAVLAKSLQITRDYDIVAQLPYVLANLAAVALRRGDLEKSATYVMEGIAASRAVGLPYVESNLLHNLAEIHFARQDFAGAASHMLKATNLVASDAGLRHLTSIASVLVDTCLETDHTIEAAELLGAVQAFRDRLDYAATEGRDVAEGIAAERIARMPEAETADAIARGAGYDRDQLTTAIRTICRRIIDTEPVVPSNIRPFPERAEYRLTPRELEVLSSLATGRTNAEIADELFVSLRTVTTHLSNIFAKLNVTSRAAAIALAMREQLVS